MLDQAVIAVRFALYTDLLIFSGLAAFLLYGTDSSGGMLLEPGRRKWFSGAAVLGLVLSALGVWITAGSMAGVPLDQIDAPSVWSVLAGTSYGTAAIIRIAALAVSLLALLMSLRERAALLIVAVAGAVSVATLAWSGHGAMDDGAPGWAHLVADVVHLWAAGLWVGAVLGLAHLLFRPLFAMTPPHLALAHDALARFSSIGTVLVALIVATGLVNSLFLVGIANLAGLWTTQYGLVLVAKLALFGLMLCLAASNRFLLTPAFALAIDSGRPELALRRLRLSLALELTSAVIIFGLVAWLGTLEPPVSAIN